MKTNSILRILIIGIILVFAGGLLYVNRSGLYHDQPKKRISQVDVAFAGNESRTIDLAIDATVESRHVVDIAFQVGGKLEKGEFLPERGMSFKKGQLLYQINNREAFAALSREKARLSALVLQLLPEIETDFPTEKNKWVRFMEELKPQFLLPELPRFNSSKERYLITEKGILTTFYELRQAEVNMANYFYLAPFDGIVLSVSEHPGNVIAPRKKIARIGTQGTFHITALVPRDYLETFGQHKNIRISLLNGKTAGQATFVSRGTVMEKEPTRYYFDATWENPQKLFHDMPVRLSATHRDYTKSCKVPVSAMDRDLIQLVKGGKLLTRRITIAGTEGDSVFVHGLENGEAYAIHYDFHPDSSMSYYPKIR